jgi:hypothetical protein
MMIIHFTGIIEKNISSPFGSTVTLLEEATLTHVGTDSNVIALGLNSAGIKFLFCH